MKEIDEGNILAAYLLVALLTFGYSWNADHVAPVKGIVNGREVVIQSGAVDTILTATFAGAFWPIYWSVTAFKSFSPRPTMSRHLTPLMLPTSLQPPLTGPSDGARVTVHRIADDDDAPPAAPTARPASTIPPAPAVHFTPRPGVQIHAAPAPKGKRMRNSPNQDAVLAAIQKKSPITRDALMKATGLDEQQLAQTVWALKKAPARIAVGGTTRSRLYGVPGTKFADSPTKAKPAKPGHAGKRTDAQRKPKPGSPESFADGVKARERELDAKTRSNGTDLLDHVGQVPGLASKRQLQFVTPPHGRIFPLHAEATALPCRAIATAAGGAIVLRGNQLTAELNAEELNVIHQLRA